MVHSLSKLLSILSLRTFGDWLTFSAMLALSVSLGMTFQCCAGTTHPCACFVLTFPVIILLQHWSSLSSSTKGNNFCELKADLPSFRDVKLETPRELQRGNVPAEPCVEGYCAGQQARVVRSSGGIPAIIDNEYASGKLYIMHKPAPGESGGDAAYFSGRKRRWETRVQLTPRKAPSGPLVFGLELSEYVPVSSATKSLQAWVVRLLQRTVGKDLYHSPGDDPAKVAGAREKPVFVMPLWAFDQIIVSEPGSEPDITGSLDGLGQLRTTNRREFIRTMSDLRLVTGKTYTFSFYCISRYLDPCRWEMTGVIPGRKISFNTFCGAPPVHVCLYELQNASDPTEKRHLEERKREYMKAAFWSSTDRPSIDKVETDLGTDGLKAWLGDDFGENQRQKKPEIQPQRRKTILGRLASATCYICRSD